MKRVFKIFLYSLSGFILAVLAFGLYVFFCLSPAEPVVSDKSSLVLNRTKVEDNFYRLGNCWLRKSKSGLWEEYVEGEPFERGVITGKLNRELLAKQESAFVGRIRELVPNYNYLKFLGLFVRFFNRNLAESIPEEYKLEVYGESFSAPAEYDFIAPAYERMLNYHGAHDIGHMMQNFALVGCTSFGVWDSKTSDSSLLIGRNCDFYAGDKFAEDKIVYFCNPKQGYKFAMITWGGMMGCLSGMNEKGVTVTINAAKSDLPTSSATPISILAREILQYASNIDAAYSIAQNKKTFVAEAIMIGSAHDHKTAIIEKSPAKLALYYSKNDYILCTNHYQSDTFKNDKNNLQNIEQSASMYRYQRLQELVNETPKFDYLSVANVLRDQKGQHEKNIGIGNEKAINQLLCHHSVIFQPEKLRIWVSTQPYQLGEYVCYDLEKIFAEGANMKGNHEISETELDIPADPFLSSDGWSNFLKYKQYKQQLEAAVKDGKQLGAEQEIVNGIIAANPEYWETYDWLGQYFKMRKDKTNAFKYFNSALTKEVNDKLEVEEINKSIRELNSK